MHQSVKVVWGKDEAVARAVVTPAAEDQVSTQAMLQRSCQVLIENWIQIVVVSTLKEEKKNY